MKKVFFAVLAICMVASMSFAAKQVAPKAEGPDLICVDDTFGPVYSLNKYIVGSKLIQLNAVEGPPGDLQIPFVCQDSWLVGTANAFATGWDGENLQFPRSSSSVLGGPEPVQQTLIAFALKIPTGGGFFGLDVLFYQCQTTVGDQVLPDIGGFNYLPIYLIDDVFGLPAAGGSTVMGLTVSPDIGVILRGTKNNRLGPWDYLVVCDLDPNDYDNDGYYEAALGFRSSPPGLSPLVEWGKVYEGEIGCAIMNHVLLNGGPGEGKFLAPNFDVMDPQPFWPTAGFKHVEALAGESEFSRPWCITVFSDGQ